MPLELYNTLARSRERFQPLDPPRVTVYGCGPTIYGRAHIGNFRTFLVYDVLNRYLRASGYEVTFVVNFTDVDDKTIKAAAEAGVSIGEFTAPFGEALLADADALGIRRFDAYPRATDHIGDMIDLVKRLEERGLAYGTEDGSVFFRISEFEPYGRLSGMDPSQVRSGDRVAGDEYDKEDARDFALWKGAKPVDERTGAVWDSPWGRGRPGWHLECSVMSMGLLGETIDIHLGGEDLIFPHHEDEIAQSEGATGKPFVRVWLHVKHLQVEGDKMAKSLGNTVRVPDLLDAGFDRAAIRHRLLSAHYRSELNFTVEGLTGSAAAIDRLVAFEGRLRGVPASDEADASELGDSARVALDRFRAALDDDLNVPGALAALFEWVRTANAILDTTAAVGSAALDAAIEALDAMDEVLGLLELARSSEEGGDEDGFASWVEERIRERNRARGRRDWARADELRDELGARGIVLEDTAEGTRWKRLRSAPVIASE